MEANGNKEPEWFCRTIELTNRVEIKFWCSMLQCTEANLIKAISEIGNSPRMVNHYLELNRLKTSPA